MPNPIITQTDLEKESIAVYESPDGAVQFDVTLKDDTVWLTQKQIAKLFDKSLKTINEHIKNIYVENELHERATIRNFRIVQQEGNRSIKRNVDHYDLDLVLHVGYRVRSKRGTQFRLWSTKILSEHIIKGYTQNTKRLAEKQIEIDIKYTKSIFKQILDNNQTSISTHSDTISFVANYLGVTQEKETIILKTHLLMERFLVEFCHQLTPNPNALINAKFTFKHYLAFARAHFQPHEKQWVFEILDKINMLRNICVHNINDVQLNQALTDCIKIFKKRVTTFGKVEKKDGDTKSVLIQVCAMVYNALHST
jgi:hypothetical protein